MAFCNGSPNGADDILLVANARAILPITLSLQKGAKPSFGLASEYNYLKCCLGN